MRLIPNLKLRTLGLLLPALLAAAGSAEAVAPANAIITNTASLSYAGLTNPITASVDVQVALKQAAPTVSNAAAITVAENQTGTLSFAVTANANGPDTYTINATNTPTNVTGSSAPTPTPASVTLGATAVLIDAVAGATAITVPADGAADGQVNGIAAGDTVVIGGTAYTVASVTDNATGTSTITLATGLNAAATVGTLIAERQTVNVQMTVGTVTPPNTSGTETVSVTAQASANGPTSTAGTGTINVGQVRLVKSVSVNGGPFTQAPNAANATSGDTLTYRMLITVPANTTITNVTLTDTIPPFTNYVPNSTTLDVDGPNGPTAPAPVADVGGTTPLAAGMPVHNAGQQAGTIAAGATPAEVSVEFQVTVQ